jgi:hypothetical protein
LARAKSLSGVLDGPGGVLGLAEIVVFEVSETLVLPRQRGAFDVLFEFYCSKLVRWYFISELDVDVRPPDRTARFKTTFSRHKNQVTSDNDRIDKTNTVDAVSQIRDIDEFTTLALLSVDNDRGQLDRVKVT